LLRSSKIISTSLSPPGEIWIKGLYHRETIVGFEDESQKSDFTAVNPIIAFYGFRRQVIG
jgi:hypothetical protein